MSSPINCGPATNVPAGDTLTVSAELSGHSLDIVVVHAEDDQFYAIDDRCTHEAVPLSDGFVEEDTLECPLHASAFCLKTGVPQTLPAIEPVQTHRVEIHDGELLLHPGVPGTTS